MVVKAPWFVKIPAKIVLSRLPVSHDSWRRLNLFRAGQMDDPTYAFSVFNKHAKAAGFVGKSGYVVLELGPGDSMLTALFAKAAGAERVILVDAFPNAALLPSLFKVGQEILREKGWPVPSIDDLSYTYMTDGLASLRSIPDQSVDFIFSHSVIEHVRKREFDDTARELYRILKPGGVASHWTDFQDHLQYALNSLRFSESVWESDFMASSGFYTNRLRAPDIEARFEKVGFEVITLETMVWKEGLPTPKHKLVEPFRSMRDEDLVIKANWLQLTKKISPVIQGYFLLSCYRTSP